MIRTRLFLALAAAVLAGVAVVWIVGALQSDALTEPAGADQAAESPQDEPATPPRWEDFAETGGEEPLVARPVTAVEGDGWGVPQVDPFERARMRRRLRGVTLRLEGVAPGDDPKALVSGRVVRLGDVVEGFRVARIDASGITLVGPVGASLELATGEAASPPAEAAAEPERPWRRSARRASDREHPWTRGTRP